MNHRPKYPCRHAGCPETVRGGGFCDAHRVARQAAINRARGSSSAMGYGGQWRKLRKHVLARSPYCEECRVRPAEQVDHIVPKAHGGSDDLGNLQGLCASCHGRKTARETFSRTGQGSVILVAGPPGAGKTTYARDRMMEGDVLVDHDALMAAISGMPSHQSPPGLWPVAESLRLTAIAAGRQHGARVWAVQCCPRRDQRDQYRTRYDADVVVLETPPATCYERVRSAPGRGEAQAMSFRELVEKWWGDYESDPRDVIVSENDGRATERRERSA